MNFDVIEKDLRERFQDFDAVAEHNTRRVLESFWRHRVSDGMFGGTTGYGYNDAGREALDAIMADVMGTEAALARLQLVSGTHTIACALTGLLRPGQALACVTGRPYDSLLPTLRSLTEWGVAYREEPHPTDANVVLIQRSRGYSARKSLSVSQIQEICTNIHKNNDQTVIVVDNCYGEFVETREPGMVGADIVVGSFIKNPGGGLAPTGGYIAGRQRLVDKIAERMTCPGLGGEAGATLGWSRMFLQGLFLAPHVVAQALKTAAFAAAVLQEMGYSVCPGPKDPRYDIVQRIELGDPDALLSFCRGIQAGSPVDSFAVPQPADMPGYDCPIVMASGSFVQGASIELGCDGPMRPPYAAYLQGGLSYAAGKIGVLTAVAQLRQSR